MAARDPWDLLESLAAEISSAELSLAAARSTFDELREAIGDRPACPWDVEEVPEAKPKKATKKTRGDAADRAADAISAVYPHGYTESGTRRPPGLKQAAAALRRLRTTGYTYEEILAGAEKYAAMIRGTPDQQYAPAMFRWIRDERWRELPEVVDLRPQKPTEEELASRRAAALEADARRLRETARRAGVEVDASGAVVNTGPKRHGLPQPKVMYASQNSKENA